MFSREDLALHVINKRWWGGTFAENGSRSTSTHSGRREKDDTGVAIPTVRVVTTTPRHICRTKLYAFLLATRFSIILDNFQSSF